MPSPSKLTQKLKKLPFGKDALDKAAQGVGQEEIPPVPAANKANLPIAADAENLVALKKRQAALKAAMQKKAPARY
jgi:hypothetical protein